MLYLCCFQCLHPCLNGMWHSVPTTCCYVPVMSFSKVHNIPPEDLAPASKAEEKSVFCQPCKKKEEFQRSVVYCVQCETKFCTTHQHVSFGPHSSN